jgi:ketosteroid isomerase-like protein
MSKENVEMIRGVYQAFANGDVPTVVNRLDANVIWNEADGSPYADGNPYVGPDKVTQGVFMRLGGEWESFVIVPEEALDAGDTVVMLGRYNGTFKRNGKPLNAQFTHVWRVKDGKVTGFQQYTDTAQYQAVCGKD